MSISENFSSETLEFNKITSERLMKTLFSYINFSLSTMVIGGVVGFFNGLHMAYFNTYYLSDGLKYIVKKTMNGVILGSLVAIFCPIGPIMVLDLLWMK